MATYNIMVNVRKARFLQARLEDIASLVYTAVL